MSATLPVDLRSDTVTRPTPGMLAAMMSASVGDDVFGEDPAVNTLQERLAALFGMEAALFLPTGTMSNQVAIKAHTQPGDEVICHELAHVYRYEGGGIALHSGASLRLLSGANGRFTGEQVRANVNRRDDAHLPLTRLVCIENTVNKGGGACWSLPEIRDVREACLAEGLALHLDGARLFNALIARAEAPRSHGELFDSISICLSKGLGTPAGSVLLGSQALVRRAHRIRKAMGGGMRQAGYLAAAGLYALDHHLERLREDHARARALGSELAGLSYVAEVLPVETNIVIARLDPAAGTERLLRHLAAQGVRALEMGPGLVRFVVHLDVRAEDLEAVRAALRSFQPGH